LAERFSSLFLGIFSSLFGMVISIKVGFGVDNIAFYFNGFSPFLFASSGFGMV